MQVELLKKLGTYTDAKTKEEKQSIRFYLRCGASLIPIQVPYFEGETGTDGQYKSRREILKAFADDLPDKPSKTK